MKLTYPRIISGLLFSLVLAVTLGCSKLQTTSAASTSDQAPSADAQITSALQSKLYADPAIQSKQISVQTANGVVTLGGTVTTEAERTKASAAAAEIAGVKTVVNDIVVTAAPAQTAVAPETMAPSPKPQPSKPAVSRHIERHADSSYDSSPKASVAQVVPVAPAPMAAAPMVPPPPPAPVKVTVEAGTSLAIRLVDSLDSETATQGQTFRATLDSPVAVDGEVVIPEGYDVQGHVVEVQSAGKFQGRSVLALQLDRIQVGSKHYSISTTPYRKEGSSRTKNTVAKVGAGSVIGAIIGGIAGGGKGAGIGAAAGGGIGGGVQAATKGQQINLPSETVLTFSLQAPLTVTPTTQGRNAARPKLDPPADSSNPPQR